MPLRPGRLLCARQIGGPNLAVIDKPDSGPQFGAEGLSIPLKTIPAGEERLAKTKLGERLAQQPGGWGCGRTAS